MVSRVDADGGAIRSCANIPAVVRRSLIETLHAEGSAGVVYVSGPAGAGKTTLMTQWANADSRPHTVIRIAPYHDEAAAFAEAIVSALESIGPTESLARSSITGQEPAFSSVVLPGLAELMASRVTPYVLVIDDVHLLRGAECVRLLRTLAEAVPRGCMLALLSRESTPLWLARFRAEGRLVEFTADDLAFDVEELEDLFAGFGIPLTESESALLLQRTEGWAVALYLEAIAARQADEFEQRDGLPSPVHGLDFVNDYIESEILDPLSSETRDFLLRSSILDDIESATCDAVLGRTDCQLMLEGLRRSTPLVTVIDRQRGAYRYHHLLHDTLRTVLAAHSDAAEIRELHARASRWYHDRGDVDAAVRHSRRAGDLESTASLIWPHVVFSVASGRPDRLARWLDELAESEIGANRWLSMAAAWAALQSADRDGMQLWILRSQTHAGVDWRDRVAFDEYAASLATLMAIEGQVSIAEGAEFGTQALTGLRPHDPWRAVAAFISAVCLTLLRDPTALTHIEEARRLARALEVPLLEADALSWRGVLSVLAGDLSGGAERISEAARLVEEHNLERFVTSAHTFTAHALVLSMQQHRERAAIALATSRRLTAAGQGIAQWFHVCGRLIQARTALNLGDAALARVLLNEARANLTDDLALSAANDMLVATETLLASNSAQAVSVAPMTAAELRVLQFLPSHLTFAQIGEHLFLSANTVKTHALSIYRKLGVTSRNQAVGQAQALGLVEAPLRTQ